MTSLMLPILLLAFRLIPIFLVAPVASFRRVPMTIRIIFVIFLAVIFNVGNPQNQAIQLNDAFGLMCLSEFIIGASLAFSFHAANAAVQTMGQLIDLQIGFAAGAVFDPSTEQMVSPTGELFTLILMVVLISANVHHDILLGLSKLFEVLPPGAKVNWNADWLKILGIHFVLGFIVVSPVLLALWFTDLTLAFISRSLPQAPIYFVGLPVKVGIGLIMLAWFAGHAFNPFLRILTKSLESWNLMFEVSYG